MNMVFTVRLLSFFLLTLTLCSGNSMPLVSFDAPSETLNFHDFGMGGGNLGFRFTSDNPFTVSALGYYDFKGSALKSDHSLVLEDASGKAIPGAAVVIKATSSLASDSFRYENVGPINLPSGTYIVSAYAGTEPGGDGSFARNVSNLKIAPGFTFVGGVYNSTTSDSPIQGSSYEAANNYFGPNLKISGTALKSNTSPPAPKKKIKVACVGDSITAGFLVQRPYPMILQALLGDGYEVKNFGVNGKTVSRATSDPYDPAPALAYDPDVVVIMLGTNDAKSTNWPAQKDQFDGDYASIIKSFVNLPSKPKILVGVPAPVYKNNSYDIQPDALNNEIAPEVAKIAEKSGAIAIDIHRLLSGQPDLFSDGVHPTDAGAQIIAQTVYHELKTN